MGQVTVTINGRSYRLRCGDGEEARLAMLADHLSLRVDRLAMDFGQHGDERLLIMAALLATDDLLEAKARLQALEAGIDGDVSAVGAGLRPDAGAPIETPPASRPTATGEIPSSPKPPTPSATGNHRAGQSAVRAPVGQQVASPAATAATAVSVPAAAASPTDAAAIAASAEPAAKPLVTPRPVVTAAVPRAAPPRGSLEARLSEARSTKPAVPPPKTGAA